jgi:glycosyltransferase involved in cell wall biosynthesis
MAKPSICILNCYKQPDYIRAVVLRKALKDTDSFDEVIVVKNKRTNALRYVETMVSLIKVRFTKNPDVYVVTFRAYEILPFVRLITAGKKLVYDEFINPIEWFVYEHKKFGADSIPAKAMEAIFRYYGKRAALILTDTQSHAEYSARLMNLPIEKYRSIPVGTDETAFRPIKPASHEGFTVLYYGNMLPLHGLRYVLEAAKQLADRPDIRFHIVGGKRIVQDWVEQARENGAHITYDAWVDYKKLPELFATSDVCLGGPFGGTVQSQFVITGKTYQFLASAKPVIIGANRESGVFTDKQNALIVPQADAAALRDAIVWAADHPTELADVGQAGRRLFQRLYSTEHIADELRAAFRDNRVFDMEQ